MYNKNNFMIIIILIASINILAVIEPNNNYKQASLLLPNSSHSGTLNE